MGRADFQQKKLILEKLGNCEIGKMKTNRHQIFVPSTCTQNSLLVVNHDNVISDFFNFFYHYPRH